MKIAQVALSKVRPYPGNPRKNAAAVAGVAASIEKFGFRQPIVVDEEYVVLVGHTRLAAAESLGLKKVPVHVAEGLSADDAKAYRLMDNRSSETATWDKALLGEELTALLEGGFDMEFTGFGADEIADLLHDPKTGRTDPDAAPEAKPDPVARPGDLWVLGAHRLICGDSTDAATVIRLLAGAKPHLMVTDPPYGVNYDPAWRKQFGADGIATGKVQNDDRADWTEAWNLFPGQVAYVWHGALHNVAVSAILVAAGFDVRSQIIWVKPRAPISRGNFHWQHEPAFYAERARATEEEGAEGFLVDHETGAYAVRVGKTAEWRGGRKQTTVWQIEHMKNDTGHGTQKPVECMRRPILNNSYPGQSVYEPFCGSGTTLIAGEMEDRPVYAVEIDPVYVDVIVERWQAFSGGVARLDSGESFDEVRAERLPAAA